MILLTGASGFVGGAIYKAFKDREVCLALRNVSKKIYLYPDLVYEAKMLPSQNWSDALKDVKTVVHCAARAHILNEVVKNPLSEFRLVNVGGTLNLATQAAEAGVKRFIFLSSIKVNGERTTADAPFMADQAPQPSDPYALSKYEAEIGLRLISEKTGMEVVIVRPPLVYGPGVKANFQAMMKWLDKGIPLPFGGIVNNKRSLVYVDNLVDLIRTCVDHPNARNQTFLVSDGIDLSTAALLQKMSEAMGHNARLVSIDPRLIKLAGRLLGKAAITDRLCDNLTVDIKKTKELLNWEPKFTMEAGLLKTAEYRLLQAR